MPAIKRVIHAKDVKPYILQGSTYESRMILDDIVAGEHTVNINHGTVKPLDMAGGGTHEKTELYFIVSGEGQLKLDDDIHDVSSGSLAVIPGGCFHSIKNKSDKDDLILLTFWMNAEDNDTYDLRVKDWGKSFKTIDEE